MMKLDCLLIEPGELPKEIIIENEFKAVAQIVHGSIKFLEDDNGVAIICCGHGKNKGLQLNRIVGDDIIAGPLLIAGYNKKNEILVSLTESQKMKYNSMFGISSIIVAKEKIKKLTQDQKDKER